MKVVLKNPAISYPDITVILRLHAHQAAANEEIEVVA